MKIFVYIIPTSKNSNKKKLEKFFKCNKHFEVIDFFERCHMKNDKSIELALKDARKRDKKSYVITIEDTSISSSDADILYETIKQVIPSFCGSSCDSEYSSCLSRSKSSSSLTSFH